MASRKVSMVEIDEQLHEAVRKMGKEYVSDKEYYYARGVFNALMWARHGDEEPRPFDMPTKPINEAS